MVPKISEKTERKNKIDQIQQSIDTLSIKLILFKEQGNTRAHSTTKKVIDFLQDKIKRIKLE
jgi:hypothetical protein